jgi:hypothetical protein
MNSGAVTDPDGPRTTASLLAFHNSRRGGLGWAVLLARGALLGVAAAAVSGRQKAGIGRIIAGAGAGAGSAVIVARVVDEVRWRTAAVSLEVDEPDAALDLMQAVRAEGVRADMVRSDSADPRVDGGAHGPVYALRYRAKDDRRVRAVLAAQRS